MLSKGANQMSENIVVEICGYDDQIRLEVNKFRKDIEGRVVATLRIEPDDPCGNAAVVHMYRDELRVFGQQLLDAANAPVEEPPFERIVRIAAYGSIVLTQDEEGVQFVWGDTRALMWRKEIRALHEALGDMLVATNKWFKER